MDKETTDEMIRKKVVYEVTYKKNVDAKTAHLVCYVFTRIW